MGKILNIIGTILLLLQIEKLDAFQPNLGAMVELPPDGIVAQTFIAKHGNLSMVKLLDTYDSQRYDQDSGASSNDNLVFHLKEYNQEAPFQGDDLTRIEFKGGNFGNHSILQLKFSPIKNSANKKFIFYIENLGENNKLPSQDKFLKIGYSKEDRYKEGELIYQFANEKEDQDMPQGDLGFWSFYSVYPHEFIFGTLKDFLSKFWLDRSFLIFYLSVIGILIWRIKKGK